jgi:hypothetical protein
VTISTDAESSPTTWAVTLFSFTNELHERTRSADDLLRLIARERLADGVEVDAAQHFVSFPDISDDEIDRFRRTIDETGLTPTMMGGYLDARLDARGPRSPQEQEDLLRVQLRAASRMGFFGVRVSVGAVAPDLAERLLPELDALDIALLAEVQAGARPDAPAIAKVQEQRARLDTDRLGFVFDSSLVMKGFPLTWIEALRTGGVPDDVIEAADHLWRKREPDGLSQVMQLVAPLGLEASSIRRLEMPFRRFGCSTIDDWDELLASVASVHLKYWDVDDSDGSVSRQTAAVKSALAAHGYTGFVCSEWGGHDWLEPDTSSALEMTRRHRAIFDAA